MAWPNGRRAKEAAWREELRETVSADTVAAPFGDLPDWSVGMQAVCFRCERRDLISTFPIRRAGTTSLGMYCLDCMIAMDIGADTSEMEREADGASQTVHQR